MKNIFILALVAITFGCKEDEEKVVRRSGDAQPIEIEASVLDISLEDAEVADSELPIDDDALSPSDMVLPIVDIGSVDMEEPLEDSEVPEVLPVSDAGNDVADSNVIIVDAAFDDM